MEDYIDVIAENGMRHRIEVLDIFNVEGYDKDYILYTKNQEVDENNIEVYVSILQNENDNYHLLNIEDDTEWNVIQDAILGMGD